MNRKHKILVTGSTGFIGRNFISATQDAFEFVPLKRENSDLSKRLRVSGLPKKVDCIIHLAHADKNSNPEELFSVNVRSTFDLLEYGVKAGIRKFVFTSTGNVYGFHRGTVKESARLNPAELYGATKAAAETLCWNYRDHYDVAVLRIFTPYGPDQQHTRLIPSLIQKVIRGDPVFINNALGSPITNPIFITDLVEVIRRAVLHDGSLRVNVGGEDPYSVLELAKLVEMHVGIPARYEYVQNPAVGNNVGSIKLMKEILKYKPKVDLQYGLKKCIEQILSL